MPEVFVAGSAHLDVLSNVTGDKASIDKIGQVSIEIGGTACNIAVNLASMGLKPSLLTAMQKTSPYTNIIAAYLRDHGVELQVVDHEMKAAVFSAHIIDGEMFSAVSSMPVETAIFEDEVIRSAMRGARCAILECNLSGATLAQMSHIARELSIPVLVASVSEEKGLRVMEILSPAVVFMNHREFAYLARRFGMAAPADMARRLNCSVIVSHGANGVTIEEGADQTHVASIQCDAANTLGAGDALLAATVANYINGRTLVESVREAVSFAVSVIDKPNCSAGERHAIERALVSLDNMATRDPMTGLFNRRQGEQILSARVGGSRRGDDLLSVCMVDIDHFKRVNDTYGHDVGDIAIKTVASILGMVVRDQDAACRWGGEEFLCILQADAQTAVRIAERIRATVLQTEIEIVGKVTVSIGVATMRDGMDGAALVKAADQGLYEAKHQGRNRVVLQQHIPAALLLAGTQ